MNYRHAYHAGNRADVMKHLTQLALLEKLGEKPAGYCVLDTHAGVGRYDLSSVEAGKTGEWLEGIGRFEGYEAVDGLLRRYLSWVYEAPGLYPGSPWLAASVMRRQDRLLACELHPQDAAMLRRVMRGFSHCTVHERDGYEAVKALLPPEEKRGLVLMDPPYEKPDEVERLVAAAGVVLKRFRAAMVAIWYPIKHRPPVDALWEGIRGLGMHEVLALEYLWHPDDAPDRLNGSGMLVINPPWKLEEQVVAALREAWPLMGSQAELPVQAYWVHKG